MQTKFTLETSKQFTEQMIESRMKTLFNLEQAAAHEIMNLINEVEKRRLHLKWGYTSLFAWLTEGIGYSSAAAYRRLESARLLKSLPTMKTEIKEKIESGALNLTTLSTLQSAIRQEEKRSLTSITTEKRAELVLAIENKSSHETKEIIAKEFPDLTPQFESKRCVNAEITMVTIPFTREQMALIQKAKELSSHVLPAGTTADLFEMILKDYIRRKDPLAKKPRAKAETCSAANAAPKTGAKPQVEESICTSAAEAAACRLTKSTSGKSHFTSAAEVVRGAESKPQNEKPQITSAAEVNSETPPNKLQNPALSSRVRRHDAVEQGHLMDGRSTNSPKSAVRSPHPRTHIEAELKRAVLRRDAGSCTHTHPLTGRRCGSKNLIEIDHIVPVAVGGRNAFENLRVLCRAHNGLAAIHTYGSKKMSGYMRV